MIPARGYAAPSATSPLSPFTFERRDPGPTDVVIEILYCGICHSDIHTVRNEWSSVMQTTYPCVPGHEIVGRVTKVGKDVKKFKEGDSVGVGCLVDSDRTCPNCQADEEQFCPHSVFTYNGPDKGNPGKPTYGGYANSIVVTEHFVLKISPKLDPAGAAPLLCAGITTYSPLRYWKVGKGMKVGVVGLGGLGHMGLKFAHAFGAHVVQFTTSPSKEAEAKRLGADEVVLSKDPDAMKKQMGTFDFILDTVSAEHDVQAEIGLLKRNGVLTLVGAPPKPMSILGFSLLFGRKTLAGSLIGGLKETQEMLDFCAEHGIVSDIEMTPIQKVNEAYERVLKSDVRYRFVIDMASLK
ncbi:Alcohol dehydrogenase, zinc-binding protein [Candidatus Koribacter versatilis Ellin345]|uniref:Alcohol dehydrogenase, zinc-binding protein n=1 Tax=Koribacter versatilis (strain Ellin345) TaxID=204669 RepID=Q1IQA3_KORVE|nr:NAD(P)-dependent alcohol dehydrogenase [Candidatus Koribacter versatilis]ABF40947.1 Alcohol dehydrogenase, zinc-binding protein [Candidatus Koribacter versatilis Ellin345]